MEKLKNLIEEAHRIEFNGAVDYYSFTEPKLFSLLETAMRDAFARGSEYGSNWSDIDFPNYFSQIKTLINK